MKRTLLVNFASACFFAALFLLPLLVFGQVADDPQTGGSGQFVPCSGATCSACDFVKLANNIVDWLIIILASVFAIVVLVSGIRLVTSGGNQSARDSAKSAIQNALIGLLIVLGAWLIIDLVMRTLVGDDGRVGSAPWGEIVCWRQITPGEVAFSPENPYTGGTVIYDCREISSGATNATSTGNSAVDDLFAAPVYNCQEAVEQCQARGGSSVEKKNASDKIYVECSLPSGSSGGRARAGSCDVPASGNCSVDNLRSKTNDCFGAGTENMAQICSKESSGGNARASSGTDQCKGGVSWSYGLFQINIIAHGNAFCGERIFRVNNPGSGADANGACIREATNSNGFTYCQIRDCEVINQNALNECKAKAFDVEQNLDFACSLYRSGRYEPWRGSASQCNVI